MACSTTGCSFFFFLEMLLLLENKENETIQNIWDGISRQAGLN